MKLPVWHLLARSDLWAGLALLILTVATFAPVRTYGLVNFDDPKYAQNMHVQNGIRDFDEVIWAFTSREASNWHPFTWMSLELDTSLFNAKPWGYHVTNLLLHTLNVLLLYILLVQMTGQWPPSALVAALFAVHPLHVESVAWVTERKDVLSTFFGLLALIAYVRYVRRPELVRGLLVLPFYAASLLAKPMLVTLPFLLLLLDFWPLRRKDSILRLLVEKLPLCALAAASCAVTFWAQQQGGAVKSLDVFTPAVRSSNAVDAVVAYLVQTAWPTKLAVYYPHPRVVVPPLRLTWEILFLLSLTALAAFQARTRPYLLFGWLWFLGTLVPVIGLVQVGQQARADRYTYVPLIGIFVALVWGIWEILPARRRGLGLAIVSLVVLVPCVVLTREQISHWRNSLALWEHALAVTSDNWMARAMYGEALITEGRYDEAERQLDEALRLRSDMDPALAQLGRLRIAQGRRQEALGYYQRAAAMRPDMKSYQQNITRLKAEMAASP